MRWLGPVVDREDDFTPFLTSHLPVRVTVLRRVGLVLVLVGFGVALGVVLHRSEQVQLAGLSALEAFVYLLLVDLPTRRLHLFSRVGVNYAALHLLTTLALIGWTWLLPLSDSAASGHGAPVLAGLLGTPHPDATGAYRGLAWTMGLLAVAGGGTLHLLIHRLGRALSPDRGSAC
jgi:hypothetical protein